MVFKKKRKNVVRLIGIDRMYMDGWVVVENGTYGNGIRIVIVKLL